MNHVVGLLVRARAGPRGEDDPRAVAGGDDHAAPARRLDRSADRLQLELREDDVKDGAQLEHREVLPGTALAPAAPRHPDLARRRPVQEALWPERIWIGVDVRVVLHQVDAADEGGWRAVGPRGDLKRPADRAGNREQEHRPVAEHLLNRGGEIALAAAVEVIDEALGHDRIASKQPERPSPLA